MSEDDNDLFQKEMAGVRPLRRGAKESVRSAPQEVTPGQLYRREAAMRTRDLDENQLPTTFVQYVPAEAILSFKRDGIQNGVFRRLQRGVYAIDATLDLHGLNVEEARGAVFRFIHDCVQHDVRSALISHGKGRGNKARIPLLKSFLARWLPMFPEIMAFHSAQKWHGGTGAVYILLRKSERAKDETREKLGLASSKPWS